jgi:hypothetical protein
MSQPVPNVVVIVPTPQVVVQFFVDLGVLTLGVQVEVQVL